MILTIICILFFILTSVLLGVCVYMSKKITDPCIKLLTKIVIFIGSICGDYIVKNNINIFNTNLDRLTNEITNHILNNINNISDDNLLIDSLINNDDVIRSFVKTYLISLFNYISTTNYSNLSLDEVCTEAINESVHTNRESCDPYNSSSHIWDVNE